MDREYVIPAPKLTDIVLPALGTGQAAWVDKLWNLKETKGVIKVMHLCDIHFPFQHNGALSIAYQLVEHFKPDVIVDGSDIGDFAMLSAFEPDPDVEDEEDDTLDDFEALYAPHENMLTMRGRSRYVLSRPLANPNSDSRTFPMKQAVRPSEYCYLPSKSGCSWVGTI